jgi:hypothetical protein
MSFFYYTAANQGGIKRGDSAETGDLEAQPSETADNADPEEELDELTVKDADDPDLGLTDIGDIPADDWAADTGPTRTGEEVTASRRRRPKGGV